MDSQKHLFESNVFRLDFKNICADFTITRHRALAGGGPASSKLFSSTIEKTLQNGDWAMFFDPFVRLHSYSQACSRLKYPPLAPLAPPPPPLRRMNSHTGQTTYQLHGGGVPNSYYQDPMNHAAPPMAMGMPPASMVPPAQPYHPTTRGASFGSTDRTDVAQTVANTVGLGLLVYGVAKKVMPTEGGARDRVSGAARQFGTLAKASRILSGN